MGIAGQNVGTGTPLVTPPIQRLGFCHRGYHDLRNEATDGPRLREPATSLPILLSETMIKLKLKDEAAHVDFMGRAGRGEMRIEIVVMVIVGLCKVGSGVT